MRLSKMTKVTVERYPKYKLPHLNYSELEMITRLYTSEPTGTYRGRYFKRYEDYETDECTYIQVIHSIRRFTRSTNEGCYKCDLYPEGSEKTYIPKILMKRIIHDSCLWRGMNLHKSAVDNFIGHYTCLRCAVSILTSENPLSDMRFINKESGH